MKRLPIFEELLPEWENRECREVFVREIKKLESRVMALVEAAHEVLHGGSKLKMKKAIETLEEK